MDKRPRKSNNMQKERDPFDQKVVEVARVTRVTSGGKRMRFRALVVIGDHKGKVGMGLRKGMDVQEAVNKAISAAKKNLVTVPLHNESIPHEIKVKFKSSRLLLKPAKPGSGVKAGGAIRSVMDLAGVKNVSGKMLGSSNNTNNIYAVFKAFTELRTPEAIKNSRK